MAETRAPGEAALAAVSEAVLGVAGELSMEAVLQHLVAAARELVGARYAALGVPDEEGTGFSRFLTSGMSDEVIEAIGPLPRTHGLLGSLLADPTPYRTGDLSSDARFTWWPEAHPRMRSFLGVPIVFKGDVIGALYLADKEQRHGGGGAATGADDGIVAFTEADEHLIRLLAAHAAVAMEHARLYEASRLLSIVEERNRLARDLHDASVQTLFSLSLTAEAAAALVTTDPGAAAAQVRRVGELAREALVELRSMVFELRPPALDADGLVPTVGKQLELIRRAHDLDVGFTVSGVEDVRFDQATELALFRIVHEALNNAVRHARAGRIDVCIDVDPSSVTVVVTDDGIGFDPDAHAIRSRRLGLTSMRERAHSSGGSLTITSGSGTGTAVEVRVPRGAGPS